MECDFYLKLRSKYPKDRDGNEMYPCEYFNAGYCEMHDTYPHMFNGECPYIYIDGFGDKEWDYDKAQ